MSDHTEPEGITAEAYRALRAYATFLECGLRAIISFNGCGVSVEIAEMTLRNAPPEPRGYKQ